VTGGSIGFTLFVAAARIAASPADQPRHLTASEIRAQVGETSLTTAIEPDIRTQWSAGRQ
jgi:hypothetical protein